MLMASRTQSRPERSSSASIVIVVVLLLVIAGGAGAYWWFVFRPSTPQFAAARFLDAANAGDTKTTIDMLYIAPEMRSMPGFSPEALQQGAAMGTQFRKKGAGQQSISYKIGETTVTGDDATVKVTVTSPASVSAGAQTQDLALKRVDGHWKVDVFGIMQKAFQRMGSQMQGALKSMGGGLRQGSPGMGGGGMGR
jgi:hypothetical protein